MRPLIAIFLIFLSQQLYAQSSPDLDRVDLYVQGIKTMAPRDLAKELTSPFQTDLEKVRAIFRWITMNISYGSGILKNKKAIYSSQEDTSTIYKSLNERIAEKVIERRWAVCDGYARLFNVLCDYTGIKSEVISGYSRTEPDKAGSKFNTNHTWNAVYIDSSWKLLDVTWASGYFLYPGYDYYQRLNDRYFLTEPEEFVKDHYPEDPKWTLLPQQPFLREYLFSPFKPSGFVRARIKSFYPSKGIIDAAIGDTITVVLETDDKEKELIVVDSVYDEEHAYDSLRTKSSRAIVSGKRVAYNYIVGAEPAEWLNVILNDRMILRYKLNIRKREEGSFSQSTQK